MRKMLNQNTTEYDHSLHFFKRRKMFLKIQVHWENL